jgi:hypothetical protein
MVPTLDQTFGSKSVNQTDSASVGEADTDRERSD